MSDVSEAVEELIDVLETKFISSENCQEKVLKSLMLATTNAFLATKNEECRIAFDGYTVKFSIEQAN